MFNDLEKWYVDTDVLEIEEKSTGGKKLTWLDEGDKYDPFVKSSRLMRSALAKVFPNAKFSERTMHGVFVIGIQSPKFVIPPNFGSFGSLEKQNQEGESNTGHDPNYDPNNFESLTGFGSLETKTPVHDPNDPNNFDHESKKADNHAAYDANDPNDPKNDYSQPASNEQTFYDSKKNPVTIGDRVVVKAGGLSGKTGIVDQIVVTDKRRKTYSAIVSSPNFGMPQTVPLLHLEKAS